MAKKKKGKRSKGKTMKPWEKGLRAARRARNAAKRAGRKHKVRAHARRVKTRGPKCIKPKGRRAYKNPRRSRKKKTKIVHVRAHRSYEAYEPCKPRRRKGRRKGSRKTRRGSSRKGLTKHQIRVLAGKKAARTRAKNARLGSGRKYKRVGGSAPKRLGMGSKRKSPKRVAAAKKAARTRAYNKAHKAYGGHVTPPSHQLAAERRHRRGRRRGRRENPLSGVELFIGTLTALGGFLVEDLVDRYVATHALQTTTNKDAAGHVIYTDTPNATGDYVGLYNGTAVVAPMNWKRWLIGGVLPLGAIAIANGAIKSTSPTARASFQMLAFGAGIRWLGKGLVDGVASLLSYTCTGQRLYDPEIRANHLVGVKGNTGDASLAGFPTTGLGRAPMARQLGAPAGARCAKCGKPGLGACCGTLAPCCPPAPTTPALPPGRPQAPTPSNTATAGPRPQQQVQGLPGLAGTPSAPPGSRGNRFNWGDAA